MPDQMGARSNGCQIKWVSDQMTISLPRPRKRTSKTQQNPRFTAFARKLAKTLVVVLLIGSFFTPAPVLALEKKPYDKQLLRLSELLGAVHYLRELCGANEGQLWRRQMSAIMKAEGSTALRRLSLTRRFNFGYRSYSRTYSHCTPSAKTAISRFINEAAAISDTMVRNIP